MPQEKIEAPMTGKIISVRCKVGDTVNAEDEICILEAMKMENPIMAPVKGKITEIGVTAGQAVTTGKMIVVIEY